jgi:undecaprenyl-diphosphatase
VLVLQESTSSSFPSGNAGLFALFLVALAFTATSRIGRQRQAVAIWCGTISLLMFIGLSRLYLGAHWFSDVFFGYLFALVWVLAAIEIKKRLEIHLVKKSKNAYAKKPY